MLLLAALKESRAGERDPAVPAERINVANTLKVLFGTGAFLILVLYFTLPAIGGWAVKNWMPTWHYEHGKHCCRWTCNRRSGRDAR
jgi:hypothetical protein